ncbi:response regulator, partial [Candidatus Dojkabacteria bacterium]|nr:response regulator [Candidatus Dojkabacteria bacterium]
MESKKSVLIIEDERMISDAIKEKLSEDAHINIITARDGRDGLDKVIAEKPDLVLLDLIMPVMNGV